MVTFSNIIVVSVYHPVRGSNGYEYELANIRTDHDRQVNTVTSKKRILIGGDFNAQIGQTSRQLHKNANNGSFGFRSTNIQGEELQEWMWRGLVRSLRHMHERGKRKRVVTER